MSHGKIISALFHSRLLGEGRVKALIVIVLWITLFGNPTFAADKIRIG